MTKRSILMGTAALGLLAVGTARPAGACFQCTSSQWCTSGLHGGSCSVEVVDGKQWCQHSLDCDVQMTMTPLEVSPTGTYLARGGAQVTENDIEKQQCNGFVVGHLASGERPGDGLSIRI